MFCIISKFLWSVQIGVRWAASSNKCLYCSKVFFFTASSSCLIVSEAASLSSCIFSIITLVSGEMTSSPLMSCMTKLTQAFPCSPLAVLFALRFSSPHRAMPLACFGLPQSLAMIVIIKGGAYQDMLMKLVFHEHILVTEHVCLLLSFIISLPLDSSCSGSGIPNISLYI